MHGDGTLPHRRIGGRSKVLASAICFGTTLAAAAADRPAQSRASFAAAINNESTSPSFVLITVVDGRTDTRREGCVLAPLLLGAIRIEQKLGDDTRSTERVKQRALAPADATFRFADPRALANIDFANLATGNGRACRLLRDGRSAYMQDRSGMVAEGQP